MPRRMKYSLEFRAQACRQVFEFSRPVREVAKDLGTSHETLPVWLRRERAERTVMVKEEEFENKVLRDELKKLRTSCIGLVRRTLF